MNDEVTLPCMSTPLVASQMHLGLLMEATGKHVASWLDPTTQSDASCNIDFYVNAARLAEAAKFDLFFVSDSPGIPADDATLLSRRAFFVTRFEPATLLSAIAMCTTRIGLAGTMSTSFTEPYNLARYFASLDHLSRGRAAWNIVTTAGDHCARNFGLEHLPPHATRYERAHEFVGVVKLLWDTFEDDAFVRDRSAALFFDPGKFHPVNHAGMHFKVNGALNCARSPQGQPVLIQAGASADGQRLAAEAADVIFTHATSLDSARAFYADMKQRIASAGRSPEHVKILPGLSIVLGDTTAAAAAKYATLQERVHPDIIRDTIGTKLETNLSNRPLDQPIPPELLSTEGNRHQAFFAQIRRWSVEENLTLRELYDRWERPGFCGTAADLADHMEHWFVHRAADGFMVSFESMGSCFQIFVDQVVPILRARGLFRHDYVGKTLRDILALPRPPNPHAVPPLTQRIT